MRLLFQAIWAKRLPALRENPLPIRRHALFRRCQYGAAAGLIVALGAAPVHAVSRMWVGSGNWSVATNWSPAQMPDATDDVVFDGGSNMASAVIDGSFQIASLTITNGYTGTNTQNGNLDVTNDFRMFGGIWRFTAGTPASLSVSNNLFLTNCTVYCQYATNGGNGAGRVFTVGGNFTLASNATINGVGLGFAAGQGPGRQLVGSGGGGGHGGEGGVWNHDQAGGPGGNCYGSVKYPTSIGSGGNFAAGGGAVRLNVTGTTTIDGVILMNGGPFSGDRGGGAGGSVWITTDALQGNGQILAQGSGPFPTYPNGMGSGGGGRIAIHCSTLTFPLATNNLSAASSPCYYTWASAGAAGTIYLERTADPLGTLIVDNNLVQTYGVYWPKPTTQVSTNVTDMPDGNLLIQNLGDLRIFTNNTLSVRGYWTNAASFSADSQSTVTFAGTNDSTVSGSNGFYNLFTTNAGKRITFTERSTNTVQGLLTLKGESGNRLILRSTGTNYWYLRVLDAGLLHQVDQVDVALSYASAAAIDAFNSLNSGSNVNWNFATAGQTNTWIGTANTNWANPANWDLARSTIQADFAVISNGCSFYPTLDFAKTLNRLRVNSGAILRLGGYNLMVASNVTVNGTLAAGTETITFMGDVDFTGGTFSNATSSVVIAGTASQSITSDGERFYRLSIANTNATITLTDTVTATNIDITPATVSFGAGVQAGAITNQGGQLTFTGPATVQNFANNAGKLTFSDTATFGSIVHHDADMSFSNDVVAQNFQAWGQGTLTFKTGTLFSATNLWINGPSATSMVLRSSSSGTASRLKVTRASGVTFADVKDSDASEGLEIRPVRCNNGGGNTHWDFSLTAAWADWVGSVSAVFTNANNWSPAGVPGSNSIVLIDGYYTTAPRITTPVAVSNLVIGGHQSVSLTVDAPLQVMEDLTVMPNGVLTHTANAGSPVYSLDVTVGRDFIVGGSIDVTGKGYGNAQGLGPGTGSQGGGGHGGEGGYWGGESAPSSTCGKCYGSVTSPVTLGSGGINGPGGGAMRVSVTGRTAVDGTISANGTDIGTSAAGAGGSIWLTTDTLEGSGTICADGGKGGSYQGYGYSHGGGGRIAICLGTGNNVGGVQLRAASLRGAFANHTGGGAGTVYVRKAGETNGACFIDNHSVVFAQRTVITSNVTDTVVGDMVLRNNAQLALATNQTFTVNGSWSNGSSFNAETGSTVVLTGSGEASIFGTNTFAGLLCATPDKVLKFRQGSSNVVLQSLVLVGPTLRSQADGSPWYLTLNPVGTQYIKRVTVKDSNASGGQTLYAMPESVNLGNNTNWVFLVAAGTIFVIH